MRRRRSHDATGSKPFRSFLASAGVLALTWSSAAGALACTTPSPPPAQAATREAPTSVSEYPSVPVPSAGEARADSGDHPPAPMLTFIGIGRGDRLADLGAGAGYSIAALAEAVGPSGVVYARHDPRTPSDLPNSAERDTDDALPTNLILMRTPLHAPLAAEAVRLDEVTFFFGYHELAAEDGKRREFNRAVLRALKPGGLYVIGEQAAPEESGLRAAKPLEGVEPRIVRADVEAAGFVFVEAADFSSSRGKPHTERAATPASAQYLLKFRKQQ